MEYVIIGLLFGILVYIFTISKYFIEISVKIVVFLKNIILSVINKFLTISRKLLKPISFPISFVVINLRKFSKKIVKNKIKMIKGKQNIRKM